METRENKFQSSDFVQTQAKFHHRFHFTPVLSGVSYEVQHSFSMFGVARNDPI